MQILIILYFVFALDFLFNIFLKDFKGGDINGLQRWKENKKKVEERESNTGGLLAWKR